MLDKTNAQHTIMEFLRDMCVDDAARARLLPDTNLMESGLIDSFAMVRLILFLEERFGVRVPDSEIGWELFASPSALASYVERSAAA